MAKFRIIDFSLSNCSNSGIDTVGVLTQYRPCLLHAYVGSGEAWDLDSRDGGVSILPPYETQTGGARYAGTADAITQNLDIHQGQRPQVRPDSFRAITCIVWTTARCSRRTLRTTPTSR